MARLADALGSTTRPLRVELAPRAAGGHLRHLFSFRLGVGNELSKNFGNDLGFAFDDSFSGTFVGR
jgi:hypothetical protein